MSDVFSKAKRSEVMAAVRGRGNRSTEWRLRARLISSGLSGWRVHATDVSGKPDFAFDEAKVAVFVDGCFWHGCHRCRNIPATNREFWSNKIGKNKKRDQKVTRLLKKSGWQVVRFWEHELKREPSKCLTMIMNIVGHKTAQQSAPPHRRHVAV
jgi:DNA mismatch endonuclease (patch repair protein)